MSSNQTNTIYVLYKIVNSDCDRHSKHYNAFPMNLSASNGARGPTLAYVKQQCAAAYGLNHLGPEGYHWRVFVEDKHPTPGGGTSDPSVSPRATTFSWWDIQDENASLPIKEAKPSQLTKFFENHHDNDGDDHNDYTSKAKGAFQSLGKTLTSAVSGTSDDDHHSPTVKVIAFKLLDLVKMHDDFAMKHNRGAGAMSGQSQRGHHRRQSSSSVRGGMTTTTSTTSSHNDNGNMGYTAPTPPPARSQQQQQRQAAAPPRSGGVPQQQQQPHQRAPTRSPPPQRQQQEASLMDFGPSSSTTASNMSAASATRNPPPPANETRAQKLKREYAEKNAQAQRVWDPVDERWVEVDNKNGNTQNNAKSLNRSGSLASTGSFGGSLSNNNKSFDEDSTKKNISGIKLDDASNAVGKSATVQAAVHARVNEMKTAQAKALQEVREREMKKKQDDYEEDIIRKQLEPKIKLWSEEHGKKKQLRALLASLHTILWPNSGWKQVTIGDLLDSKKCKVQFHKASRVVHPDKTHHLPADQRFLAKRIFDALSQAKNEFDEQEGK